MNHPKSGTMLPMIVAESSRHRAKGREKGKTAAACEIVNGIGTLRRNTSTRIPDPPQHVVAGSDAVLFVTVYPVPS